MKRYSIAMILAHSDRQIHAQTLFLIDFNNRGMLKTIKDADRRRLI
jgi:hypothetical protein